MLPVNASSNEPPRMLSNFSAEDLRKLYVEFPVAACLIDRAGRYVAVNHELADLLGMTGKSLTGRHVRDLFGQAAYDNVMHDFATFDAGLPVPNHAFSAFGRDFLVAVRPLREATSDRIVAISVALTDITEQKKLESRLELSNRQLSEANHKLTEAARTDALTGLWNRHALEELLPWEIGRSLRERAPLSVLMVDIDYFKRYNDHYGHLAGDDALHAVAHAMSQTLKRPGDMVARYGGEEFLVVLPSTPASDALVVAANLQKAIAALALTHEASPVGRLTVSIGVASLPPEDQPKPISQIRAELIDEADQALYAVKQNGRDGVKLFRPDESLADR